MGSGYTTTIESGFDNNKFVNKGSVHGFIGSALNFSGDNAEIINKASGLLTGSYGLLVAPAVATTDLSFVNHGKVFASDFGASINGPGDVVIENYGEIFGGSTAGVLVSGENAGDSAGPMIVNEGLIHSNSDGLYLGAGPGLKTTVINKKGGVIEGGGNGIRMVDGPLDLTNKGKIKGGIRDDADGDGNNKIVNAGKISGTVILGDGDDVFKSKDGKANKLVGGQGDDKFVLGSKADKIVFAAKLDEATNIDRIKQFESGEDTLYLEAGVFGAWGGGALPDSWFRKGTEAQDADDHIIYDKDSGALYYDADGNLAGGVAQIQFAQLDKGAKLKASDILVSELFW